jgi:hypothetical protein
MARSAEVLSHWHILLDDFSTPVREFYENVETKLKARGVPEIRTEIVLWNESGILSAKREYLRIARGRLTYDVCAAPYAANSFFFSTWMAMQPPANALLLGCGGLFALLVVFGFSLTLFGLAKGLLVFVLLFGAAWVALLLEVQRGNTDLDDTLSAMPAIGFVYRLFFKPVTYYAEDTRIMLQESVQRAISDAIAEIRTAKGLRALAPEDLRPTMRSLLG